jgi:hypothetical protein
VAPESAEEIRRKLAELEASYAHELERSEAALVKVARQAVGWSQHWWPDGGVAKELEIERGLRSKFTVCFPMAAHAINHVDVALSALAAFPWVAKSNARIAFEHALTAQWVLLTADGEARLKSAFDRSDYTRRDRFIDGIRRIGEADIQFADAAHGLTDAQLDALIGSHPHEPGPPNVEGNVQAFC